jgi:hypothetical protein
MYGRAGDDRASVSVFLVITLTADVIAERFIGHPF